ncbi:hypothetical protein HYU90_00620 [Candidatus Collierbacteria bacterium]|nr:hypothetical protein [Candidatus Collierbacteria bacterium]
MTELTGDFLKRSGAGKGIRVRVILGKDVESGVEGKKAFGEVIVVGDTKERRGGQLFVKYAIHPHDSLVSDVMKKYYWLKKKGLPVVPTLRFDDKTNSLLMTDLTDGGKNIIVDSHHSLSEYGIKAEQISNLIEIQETLRQIAEQAYDDGEGMKLDDDNYSVVLEKDGFGFKGKVFLVDLGYGAKFIKDLNSLSNVGILEGNLTWAKLFLSYLLH